MDLSKLQWLPVTWGAIAWAIAITMVLLRHRKPTPAQRELDFACWKATQGAPHATFAEFLASEQAPRS